MLSTRIGLFLKPLESMAFRQYSSSVCCMNMHQPRRTKFRKQQVGGSFNRIGGAVDFTERKYGVIELKSITSGRVTAKQIEAMKMAITKIIKKAGRVIVKIFPHTPISQKPLEVRMGKGKGAVDHWVAKVGAGASIVEIESEMPAIAIKALESGQFRLPIRTRILTA